MSTQQGAKKPNSVSQSLEDDDNCSEFSVISVYDDQDDEDGESTHPDSFSPTGNRVAYREPSVNGSEYPDNLSSISHHLENKNNGDSIHVDQPEIASPLSAQWNPLTLSGYVSTSSVAELVDKVLNEYTQNHELLKSINSSIMELKKTGKSESGKEESEKQESVQSSVQQQEIEQLREELAKANNKIAELETEKHSTEQQFKSAAKDAEHYILQLEAQLSNQCQLSKSLREELDERMDELRASRLELSTQRTIVSALQAENAYNSEQVEEVRNAYNEKIRHMEKMFNSYHERGESRQAETQTDNSTTVSTPSTRSFAKPSPTVSSISGMPLAKNNYGLTCPLCHCDCPSPDYYNYHMRTHAGLHHCKACNFYFDSEADLKTHQVEVHQPKECMSETDLHIARLESALQAKGVVPVKEHEIADLISFADCRKPDSECPTPISEISASLMLDVAIEGISDAEEAMSDDGFHTPEVELDLRMNGNFEVDVVAAYLENKDGTMTNVKVKRTNSNWSRMTEPEEPDMSVLEFDSLDKKNEKSVVEQNETQSQLSGWSSQAVSNCSDVPSVQTSEYIIGKVFGVGPDSRPSSVISTSMSSVHSSQIGASASQIGAIESKKSTDNVEKVEKIEKGTKPFHWSPVDKSIDVTLSFDFLQIQFQGKDSSQDAAAVRSLMPIAPDCKLFYFEITIVEQGDTGYIGLGLCDKTAPLNRLPGWDTYTYGYHGDDGCFFLSNGKGTLYGPKYSTGDVVGCGLNLQTRSLFFTKNGRNLGVAARNIPLDMPLYPFVGLQSRGSIVDTNFGQIPFKYELNKHVDYQPVKEKPRVAVPAQPLPISQLPIQHQIFVCDCLCAFPTKGALITHKVDCEESKALNSPKVEEKLQPQQPLSIPQEPTSNNEDEQLKARALDYCVKLENIDSWDERRRLIIELRKDPKLFAIFMSMMPRDMPLPKSNDVSATPSGQRKYMYLFKP